MSMITGCPACGTMFRVVADQLKISEGWVRCGHCGEVFDATENLQPGERQAEAPVPAAAPMAMAPDEPLPAHPTTAAVQEAEIAPPQQQEQPRGQEAAAGDLDEALPIGPAREPQPQVEPEPASPSAIAMGAELSVSASGQSWESQPTAVSAHFDYSRAFREADEADPETAAADSRPQDSVLDDLSFVRQARRQAFWRRPLVRIALLLFVLALAALLAAQFALRERDRLAAAQPQWRPLLEQLCARLGCTIGAPRRIESIVIDNSGFTRLRPDVYRLSFTLKNPSRLPVALPALQLTLTDTQEQPVVQRVLMPGELGAAPAALAAGADWSASVALAVSPDHSAAARIAGYRLLAFYP